MRSASSTAIAALAVSGLLAGCTTTMQQAARLQLNSARIRASELSTHVKTAGRALHVGSVELLSVGGATAIVVRLRNASDRPVGDLPISVGLQPRGKPRLYLNAQSGRDGFYFDAHVPVVAPRTTFTWVYTLHRRLPAAARPFAIVGPRPAPAVPAPGKLPVISATVKPSAATGGGHAHADSVRVSLHNLSAIPQYQLQVYAFARHRGRYVAAGRLTVEELDGGASGTYRLGLVGRPDGARPQITAFATTLQ